MVGQRCGCVRTQPGPQRMKSRGDLAPRRGRRPPPWALPTPPTHLRAPASPACLCRAEVWSPSPPGADAARSRPHTPRCLSCAQEVCLLLARRLWIGQVAATWRVGCNHTFPLGLIPALGRGPPSEFVLLWVPLPADNFRVFFAPL